MDSRKLVEIAPGVHWYSAGAVAGNVYFVQSAPSWVLIDTATAGQGRRIREAAEALFGAGARPAAILLTHVHPDHSGSALELARAWDCPVYLHPDEMELAIARNLAHRGALCQSARSPDHPPAAAPVSETADRGDDGEGEPPRSGADIRAGGGSAGTARMDEHHHARPLSRAHRLSSGDDDRVLISGDALLTVDAGSLGGVLSWVLRPDKPRVCEPPWYTNWDRDQMMASAGAVIRLQPQVLAPGHGRPLSGAAAASELRAYTLTHGLMQAGLEHTLARADDHTCSSGRSRLARSEGLRCVTLALGSYRAVA